MVRIAQLTLAALLALAAFQAVAADETTAGKVAATAEEAKPLGVGATIPDVAVKTVDGATAKLRDMVKEKPAVIVFFRGGWCPFCTKHLAALNKIEPDLVDLGVQILAISPDTTEEDKAIAEKHKVNYTLLSDEGLAASKQFGVVFQMDPETIEKYKGYKLDLSDTEWQVPVPTVLVVDKEGVIKFQHSEADYKMRLAPEEVLAAAKDSLK
ncbi:MAG: peroxiredoxin [Candidatus Hydrogenedentota bacterium]